MECDSIKRYRNIYTPFFSCSLFLYAVYVYINEKFTVVEEAQKNTEKRKDVNELLSSNNNNKKRKEKNINEIIDTLDVKIFFNLEMFFQSNFQLFNIIL